MQLRDFSLKFHMCVIKSAMDLHEGSERFGSFSEARRMSSLKVVL